MYFVGWSDFHAIFLTTMGSDDSDLGRVIGDYSVSNTKGIRRYPYSTSTTYNPLTYASANVDTSVHRIGEIWAVILYECFWGFIKEFGFKFEIGAGYNLGKGNTMFFQLVIDGLKSQPCGPTFVSARDAIIQADSSLFVMDKVCEERSWSCC